jgi:osmoprotectant transport system permease protein
MKLVLAFFITSFLSYGALAGDQIVVGSKIFTESYILGETAAQIIEGSSRVPVNRKLGLGSTGVLFESLKSGGIDVYPDYTGTLAETILKKPELKSIDEIRSALAPLGLTISGPLGFNNTYALAVKESFAEKYNLHSISDLRAIESKITTAFSYEFMDRKDGYVGMVDRYRFTFDPKRVRRMEHSLVYQAIREDAVDVIEVYSTDANIKKFNLRVLTDDRDYFPLYQAVWVARSSFVRDHPAEWNSLLKYEGAISDAKMLSMNASADIDKSNFGSIASGFLGSQDLHVQSMSDQIFQRTQEHLWLVGIALLFSILIGIPLGIVAARSHLVGQGILLFSALVQTIPALALLCFLIPLFGVGMKPALVALCLYSLLPVVLNTFTGIRSIDQKHIENAKAFGLSRMQVLVRIVLPLASPTILNGVKTATIVSIGTATLAALVGAGGYGALIISGLSLNNVSMILTGAIPAAVMALLAHLLFDAFTRVVIPKGLRKQR